MDGASQEPGNNEKSTIQTLIDSDGQEVSKLSESTPAREEEQFSESFSAKIEKKVNLLSKKIKKLEKKLERIQKKLDKTTNKISDDFNDKVSQTQQKIVESLAIFVAFFTFVSIEFQLVKSFDFSVFVPFTLMFAGLLCLFPLTLHIITNKSVGFLKTLFITTLIALVVGYGIKLGERINSGKKSPTNNPSIINVNTNN